MKWLRKHLAYALAAILVAVGVFAVGGVTPAFAAPTVDKQLAPNNDGTYTLSLSVTGDASSSSSSSKANVVIVFDASNSMTDPDNAKTDYAADDNGMYGLVNGRYVELQERNGRIQYWQNGWFGGSWRDYTGQRYAKKTVSRMDIAKQATETLIDQLLANNTEQSRDTVVISLVNFATKVNESGTTGWSTDAESLVDTVKGYNTDYAENVQGGTNWEAALKRAKTLADDKAQAQPDEETYIIFVSDGDPTFRDSQYSGRADDNDYLRDWGVWGTGNSDPFSWNLKAAKRVVNSLNSSYHLYTIGAFGDATKMQSLGGTYYDASDAQGLNQAFADIITNITSGLSYKDVVVTDNLTALTAAVPAGSTATDFTYTYTKDGQPYTPDADHKPGDATLNGSQVNWPFGGITLEKGVTYTVSFKVWPSQDAYDLLADLNNGKKSYDSLSKDEKDMVVNNGGTYSLRTNTPSGNELTYTKVETTTVNGNTSTTETPNQKVEITNRPDMALTDNQVSVKKEWPNKLDKRTGTGNVVLTVSSDAETPAAVDVTLQPTGYEGSVYVAPGIMTGSAENGWTIYDTGHDYTLAEKSSDNGYYWEFSTETYHPMLVNGELKMLVKKDGGQYTINDVSYAEASGTAALTAKNNRRSNVNLKKVVVAANGVTAPADAKFKFKLTVTDAHDDAVWYSIDNGQSQSFTSGSTVEVVLMANQNLRIFNLPTGSSYTFEETGMPKGFSFKTATLGENTEEGLVVSKTVTDPAAISGNVTDSNKSYQVTFTNSYDKVTLSSKTNNAIQATKNVTGADAAEQFAFKLEAKDDVTKKAITDGDVVTPTDATATTKTDGNIKKDGQETVDFGDVTFYKEGTYNFTIDETTKTTTPGWTYDDSVKDVTVVVSKNAETGKLEAAVTGNNPTFTNSYHETKLSSDTKNPVQVKKTVTGAATEASFSFTLAAGNDATAKAVKDGVITLPGAASTTGAFTAGETKTVDFGDVTFRAAGEYTFKVTENITTVPAGWSYDTSEKTITVKVEKNEETGDLTATITSGVPEFTNSYSTKPVEYDSTVEANALATKVVKTSLNENAWAGQDGKTFTFTITPSSNNTDPDVKFSNGTVTVKVANGEPQVVDFGKATFSKPGTYTFTITEDAPGGGWTSTPASGTVTIEVKDNGNGTLSATRKQDTPAVAFENTYGVTPVTPEAGFQVTKELKGATLTAGQFSFQLLDAKGNVLQTKTNGVEGDASKVVFDPIKYTEPGTYTYTIKEVKGDQTYYTYDTHEVTVSVKVTDKGDGTMAVSDPTYEGSTTFSNGYTASTDDQNAAHISAKKELTGRALEEGQFSFQLTDAEGKVLQTKTNAADGSVTFDPIKYDYSELGFGQQSDEQQTEPENGDALAGDPISETTTEGDDTQATKPEATTPEANATEPEATDSKATEPNAEEPEATEPATEPAATDENPVTQAVDALKSMLLPTTAVADENTATPKASQEFTYYIQEVKGTDAGYTYDSHKVKVTVKVTDEGEGKLSTTVSYDTEGGAIFKNSYTATGETGDSVKATKTLTGRDMAEGEFEFALLDEAGKEVATGKNAADGTVTFSSIKYDQTMVGDHNYTMVEKGGTAKGVTYDDAKLPVKVTVTDKGDGTLACAVSYEKGNTFTNTYKPLPTGAYITAQKVLNGRDLKVGEFSFELLDADGKVIDTRTNAADGTVKFDNLSYDVAGTYTYKVREVKGDDANVTYDTNEHTYTVEVKDVDGELKVVSVKADGSDQAAVFTNTYTEPEKSAPAPEPEPQQPEQPRRPLPNSGDASPLTAAASMAALGLAAVALALRKKRATK